MLFSVDPRETQLARDHPPIDRQRRSRQRARAERHHRGARQCLLEALAIAPEHLDVSEQVMRERYRLRALQMRVAGHDSLDVAPRESDQRAARADRSTRLWRRSRRAGRAGSRVRPDRCASARCAACGRTLADQRDQPALDREMDVLVGDVELEAALRRFRSRCARDRERSRAFRGRDQSDLREHLGMRDRAADVVAEQPPIEGQRCGERFNFRQTSARESPANQIARDAANRRYA